jgi:hypothetical protein
MSTTLLTGMTGISFHMQWPLTSQSHGNFLRVHSYFTFVEKLRFAHGPLHPNLCFWSILFKKIVSHFLLLLLTSLTFIRYVFIFWLKNPAAVKEDFWYTTFTTLCYFFFFVVAIYTY